MLSHMIELYKEGFFSDDYTFKAKVHGVEVTSGTMEEALDMARMIREDNIKGWEKEDCEKA